MPFEFKVNNADALAEAIGEMIGKITYFGNVGMPREMSEWQMQDMHRKRAATRRRRWRAHKTSAETIIRPHSRFEVERSRRYQQRLSRRLRSKHKRPSVELVAIEQRHSMRPILRESLYQRFVERMSEAMQETIVWK